MKKEELFDEIQITAENLGMEECKARELVARIALTMKDYDFNFSWNMFVKCSDLDKRCVHMSYLQLGLAGIPAEIEWADSMTGQVMEKWRTPTMMMFWERFERYSR